MLAVVLVGQLSYAHPPVVDLVVENRVKGRTEYDLPVLRYEQWNLLGVDDCQLIGHSGWVELKNGVREPVLVVDCSKKTDTKLSELGLIADQTDLSLKSQFVEIVLFPYIFEYKSDYE